MKKYLILIALLASCLPSMAAGVSPVGIESTGIYWGGLGESIDVRSGNLSYQYPLLRVSGKAWAIQLPLAYNSQIWTKAGQNPGVASARDLGVGAGWTLQFGSIRAVYDTQKQLQSYEYIDATGARYSLDQRNGTSWSSKAGFYAVFDSSKRALHFFDGSKWTFGSVSAASEQDAGTLYPTLIEDANGVAVRVTYAAAIGESALNTSSRILEISDSHASSPQAASYQFTYNQDEIPHLVKIESRTWFGNSFALSYTARSDLSSPFGDGASSTPVVQVASITALKNADVYQFQYSSQGTGELAQVTFPLGGHLRWTYTSEGPPAGILRRAVNTRFLQWSDVAGEREYQFKRIPAAGGAFSRRLVDVSGNSFKTWTFAAGTLLPQRLDEGGLPSGKAKRTTLFRWAADEQGRKFLSAKVETLNPGSDNAKTRRYLKERDQYGNEVQESFLDYNSNDAAKTINRTYSVQPAGDGFVATRLTSATVVKAGKSRTVTASSWLAGAAISGRFHEPLLDDGDRSTLIVTHPLYKTRPSKRRGNAGLVTYSYGKIAPQIVGRVGKAYTNTYLDGFGRISKIESVDAQGVSHTQTYTYDAASGSAFGKIVKKSLASTDGGAQGWQTVAYDSLGSTNASRIALGAESRFAIRARLTRDAAGKELISQQSWTFDQETRSWKTTSGQLGRISDDPSKILRAVLAKGGAYGFGEITTIISNGRTCVVGSQQAPFGRLVQASFYPRFLPVQCGPTVDDNGNALAANPGTIQTVSPGDPVPIVFDDGTTGYASITVTIEYMTDDTSMLDQAVDWLTSPQGEATVAAGLTLLALAQPEFAPLVLAMASEMETGAATAAAVTGVAAEMASDTQAMQEAADEIAPAGERLALGLGDYLEDFADQMNASTWQQFADPLNWQSEMITKLSDPTVQKFVNLTNVDVWGGIQRAAAGTGGATDWELLQIYQNSQWQNITFYNTVNGVLQQVPNPFTGQ